MRFQTQELPEIGVSLPGRKDGKAVVYLRRHHQYVIIPFIRHMNPEEEIRENSRMCDV
jgi:hypothetical protein